MSLERESSRTDHITGRCAHVQQNVHVDYLQSVIAMGWLGVFLAPSQVCAFLAQVGAQCDSEIFRVGDAI